MPFKDSFEKSLNDNMHEDEGDGQPGRAPPAATDAGMDLKSKGYPSPHLDVEDQELNEKKDRPPRFSTIFGAAPAPTPPQPPQREYVREYYPDTKRKSGVFMPMPLFIIFAVMLGFESTILFAYTVIGLYNNAPSRLFPWAGGQSTAVATTCDCTDHRQPAAINFAPNFLVPGQVGQSQAVATQFITVTPTVSSTSTSSSTSSSTTPSTTPTHTATASLTSSTPPSTSIAIVTVAPEPSTVTSIKLVTEDASGNVVSARPTPTTTLTTFVDPPAPSQTAA